MASSIAEAAVVAAAVAVAAALSSCFSLSAFETAEVAFLLTHMPSTTPELGTVSSLELSAPWPRTTAELGSVVAAFSVVAFLEALAAEVDTAVVRFGGTRRVA